MAMANHRTDSEEETLFRNYPYALYFVQSPSTISHATNNLLYDHLTYTQSPTNPTQLEPTRLALSRYSSSRGSNTSFSQESKKKNITYSQDIDDQEHGLLMEINNINGDEKSCGGLLVMKNIDDRQVLEEDEDEDYYDEENGGWIKYLSFSYSNSGWWILVQLSWRFLLSLMIGLAVFYFVAKPPPPTMSIKIARIQEFRLAEGVDGSGVTTKILSMNCSMDVIIDNKSKLFGLHIDRPIIQMSFARLPFAMSQGGELYAGSNDLTLFRLSVGTRNKAMYGAGRNMQDLLESGKGLHLVINLKLRSSFHVVLGLFHSKFHHEAQCLVVLGRHYDKKHRTQVYNSTCTVN